MANEMPYEIFRQDNGKLLDIIYGESNARIAAQQKANHLDTVVGYHIEKGELRWCAPRKAKAWLFEQRLKENAGHLLDALERIIADLEGDDMTVSDTNKAYASNVVWDIRKGF